MDRILKLVLFFFWLAFWLPCGSCYAEEVFQITGSQLQALETRFNRLQQINTELLKDCQQQNADLKKSKDEIIQWKTKSANQELLLANVNKSFETFAKQEKERIRKLKIQRGVWCGVAVVCIGKKLIKKL